MSSYVRGVRPRKAARTQLDQGTDAYEGTGRDLLNDPKVIGLYLGTLGQE